MDVSAPDHGEPAMEYRLGRASADEFYGGWIVPCVASCENLIRWSDVAAARSLR